jgi:EmrB/QacA subfamily drug resistance transporter
MATTVEAVDLGGVDPAVYERRYAILATMCLSLVLIVATVSSVNVAIPSLARSALKPSDTQILWIVDAYALVFAALLLPAGAIGDRFGRKGALLVGLVIFAVMSAACAVVKDANALIACRALMGIGAALIMPSTLSLLQTSFPPKERPKAIATWAGFAGAGGALGPLIGGFLLDHYWYGAVFFVATPLAAIAFVASAILAPKSREATAPRLDLVGAALSVTGFAALLAAIIEGPEEGWGTPLVIAGFVLAVLGLVGFVVYERRKPEPMLDMTYFRKPRFAMGAMGITFAFFSMFSLMFVLTQLLQYIKGYTPFSAGVRTLPFAFVLVIVSPRAVKLVVTYGVKVIVGIGLALLVIGLLMFSFIGVDTSYTYFVVCMLVMGFGVALAMPSLSTGIVQSVPLNKAGVGSAVNDTTREVGGAMGIAVVGSIVTTIYRDHLAPVLTQLAQQSPEGAQAAGRNVGQALAVADQIESTAGKPQAEALRRAVRQSFVDGAHVGLRASAALAAVALTIVVIRLPDKAEFELTSQGQLDPQP